MNCQILHGKTDILGENFRKQLHVFSREINVFQRILKTTQEVLSWMLLPICSGATRNAR